MSQRLLCAALLLAVLGSASADRARRLQLEPHPGAPRSVATLQLSRTAVAFDGVENGSISLPQEIRLLNSGRLPLRGLHFRAYGDFRVQQACPSLLPAGGGCALRVFFAPRTAGSQHGALVVSARGVVLASVALSGESLRVHRPQRDITGRSLLQDRGLYVQIERRGWASEYWTGQLITGWDDFDSVVGSTQADEAALQMEAMRQMGVNTITIELRTANSSDGTYSYPTCDIPYVLGFHWPQPTATELANIVKVLDLAGSKGMKVWLRLVNTHMEEDPPTNSATWLGAILGAVKNHPALDLVLFEGDAYGVDTNGDGIPDTCGTPAEPPLWLGATSYAGKYVQWAMQFALNQGWSARRLSAEAIVGAYFVDSQPPAGPSAEDSHLWPPLAVEKTIFDNLNLPPAERTYALSFYLHRKCDNTNGIACTDEDLYQWAEDTAANIETLVGPDGRVVAPEMGYLPPVDTAVSTSNVLETLIAVMEKHRIEGGTFWRWTSFSNSEDSDTTQPEPVKRRGTDFVYNPVEKLVLDLGGLHLQAIPNASFETDANQDQIPDQWAISGSGTAASYLLTQEQGEPEVPTRGVTALRLVTGAAGNAVITASTGLLHVSHEVEYTTTANLRFTFSGDPNPAADPATRPQVFVRVEYFRLDGSPSLYRTDDWFRYFQEDSTTGFGTFPLRYTTPPDAWFVRLSVGAARNGLASPITADVDNVR